METGLDSPVRSDGMEVCKELKPVPMLRRSTAFGTGPTPSLCRKPRVEFWATGFANIERDAPPP
jgi:hypothetical protein